MMEYRMAINTLAYEKQAISDRILRTLNGNLQALIEEAWVLTARQV